MGARQDAADECCRTTSGCSPCNPPKWVRRTWCRRGRSHHRWPLPRRRWCCTCGWDRQCNTRRRTCSGPRRWAGAGVRAKAPKGEHTGEVRGKCKRDGEEWNRSDLGWGAASGCRIEEGQTYSRNPVSHSLHTPATAQSAQPARPQAAQAKSASGRQALVMYVFLGHATVHACRGRRNGGGSNSGSDVGGGRCSRSRSSDGGGK